MALKQTRFPPTQRLNVAVQNLHIQSRFPGFRFHPTRGGAVWHGVLQPRELSGAYTIELQYQLTTFPKVYVRKPSLVHHAPHVYPDGHLCLYWPREWRWQPNMLIAETILPWTALWLYYYELWLDTGKWLGPSSHDAPATKQKEAQ